MRILILSLLVVTDFPSALINQVTETEIRAAAAPAIAELTPRSDADRALQLPKLDFALRVQTACRGEAEPRSLSISIADTRLHFTANQLQGTPMLEATLTLPRSQLAPVKVDGFCRSDEPDGPLEAILEDAYTARLSLRCGIQEQESIAYATLPLDVALLCRHTDISGPAPDQDSESLDPLLSF